MGIADKMIRPTGDNRKEDRPQIMRTVLVYCEQNCKPGSVFDSHLSRRAVANALQPPRERPGQPVCSHTGVAPDRVYSIGRFHADGCALTTPFHPYHCGKTVMVRVESDFCEITSAVVGILEKKGGAPPPSKSHPFPAARLRGCRRGGVF